MTACLPSRGRQIRLNMDHPVAVNMHNALPHTHDMKGSLEMRS
jgi:hypothetical protein